MAAIGIMGGTFNPIHIGHIKIAQAAYTQYNLDEVWFMPNHIPDYKPKDELISGKHRLAMVKLAVADIPNFKVSDYELEQSGNTYTAKTFQGLCDRYKEHNFYFIMGADSLEYFDKWRNPEIILQCAKILVAPRDDDGISILEQQIKKSNIDFGGEYFYPINCSLIPCSSHEIRNAIYNNEILKFSGVKKFLPDSVYEYIIEHGLYNYM